MKTLQQHLDEWDNEVKQENARFTFKHAIRLQGLFLSDNNEITNANGRHYGTLGEVKWRDANIIEAKVKLAGTIDFVTATLDIERLRK